MTHIMLDLETWGTTPGSALRSIGAVAFNLQGDVGAEFYANIDKQSCLDVGLTVSPSTEKWWSQQSQQAQDALLVDPLPLHQVAGSFHAWFRAVGGTYVWAQGANFDPGLWEAAVAAVKLTVPWKFYNVRDTRTAYDLFGFDPRTLTRAGTYHNALADAKHQMRCVQTAVANQRVL